MGNEIINAKSPEEVRENLFYFVYRFLVIRCLQYS